MKINDLVERIELQGRRDVRPVVRAMLDRGLVCLDDDLYLSLNK